MSGAEFVRGRDVPESVVSLGCCGPLPVMLASLFILDSISGISLDKKVPASVFKKNDLRNNPLFLA